MISEVHAAPKAIHCGNVLDVRAGRLIEDQVISWDKDGVIIFVGPANSAPKGITRIDLSGLTCLPGLIDVHTHVTCDTQNSGYKGLSISAPRETMIGVKNARLLLLSGFTSIRNVGASHYTDVAVRDGINAGEILSPLMVVSGPPLTITGGHCDENLLPSGIQL